MRKPESAASIFASSFVLGSGFPPAEKLSKPVESRTVSPSSLRSTNVVSTRFETVPSPFAHESSHQSPPFLATQKSVGGTAGGTWQAADAYDLADMNYTDQRTVLAVLPGRKANLAYARYDSGSLEKLDEWRKTQCDRARTAVQA